MPTETKERKLRHVLRKAGYRLHKSRVQHINGDNLGGYRIVDLYGDYVVAGSRFELDLDDVTAWIEG